MISNLLPMVKLARAWTAPYESLLWFSLWHITREQCLNVDALAAHTRYVAEASVRPVLFRPPTSVASAGRRART